MKSTGRYRDIIKALCFFLSILYMTCARAQPVITNFSPATGAIGTMVNIAGFNFDPNPENNIVYFGAVRASVISANVSTLNVAVPAGATYEPITVTVSNLTAYSNKPFLVTFPGGGSGFLPGSFASKIDFVTGPNPQSCQAGDFDGDGKADLAVANAGSNTISIYRNTATNDTIAFSAGLSYSTGVFPTIIATADLDGDGRLDLITANYNSNNISVLRNISSAGNISFANKIDIAIGGSAVFVAARDLDLDGKPDLAVLNNTANLLSLFKNTGSIGNLSFASKLDYPTGRNPQGLWIGDMTGDLKPEIAVVKGDKDTLSVYKNNSAGSLSFGIESKFPAANAAYSVIGADINSDGSTDLITASSDNALIFIHRNTSNVDSIGLVFERVYAVEQMPLMTAVSDMDGDGKPDICVANSGSRSISVLKNASNNGSFSFLDKVSYATGAYPASLALCDFNGDGKPDIAVANSGSNTFSILKNTVTNPYSPKITSFTPNSVGAGTEVTITGSNLTGASSVSFGGTAATSFVIESSTTIKAIVDTGSSGSITVTTPNGNALIAGFIFIPKPAITSFTPSTAGTDTVVTITGVNFTNASKVTFGGIDARSFTIVSSTTIKAIVAGGSSGEVSVKTNGGTATLAGFVYIPPPVVTSFSPSNAAPGTTVMITGTNFSGITQVNFGENAAASYQVLSSTSIQAVVGSVSGGKVSVYNPYGVGSLEGFYNGLRITSFTPTSGTPGTTVVINGTNFSAAKDSNSVYFGAVKSKVLSAGVNQLTVLVPSGATYEPVSVTVNKHTAFTKIPFNITFRDSASINKNSFFSALTLFTDFNANPYDAAIGDLNGDGKPDLAVPNTTAGSFSIFKNISSVSGVSFAPKVDYPTVANPNKIIIADIDGDSKQDVIVQNNSTYAVYRNTGTTGEISFAPPVNGTVEGISYERAALNDFDMDGKPDLANAGGNNTVGAAAAVIRNTTNTNGISFAPAIFFPAVMQPQSVVAADFDGDGIDDMALSNFNYNKISVFRNFSIPGKVDFQSAVNISADNGLGTLAVADFNGDQKPDLAVANHVYKKITVYQNTGSPNTISFAPGQDYAAGTNPYNIIADDFNGDGKVDLATIDIIDTTLSLFENNSANGEISFKSKIDFLTGTDPVKVSSGDLDADGKTDLVVANFRSGTISIFKNRVVPAKTELCPGGSAAITSNLSGSNYQWQVNAGGGFTDISNDLNYSGTNTNTLQINNAPSNWTGYQYRCVVGGNNSEITTLKFINIWTGAIDSAWENAGNWSCGSVPDGDTDVAINSLTVVVSSNVSCRSLQVNTNASVIVNPGYTITLTK